MDNPYSAPPIDNETPVSQPGYRYEYSVGLFEVILFLIIFGIFTMVALSFFVMMLSEGKQILFGCSGFIFGVFFIWLFCTQLLAWVRGDVWWLAADESGLEWFSPGWRRAEHRLEWKNIQWIVFRDLDGSYVMTIERTDGERVRVHRGCVPKNIDELKSFIQHHAPWIVLRRFEPEWAEV